ncbi:hypothetical protein SLE2022_278490 [Rubroshorea leprosula]
MSADVTMEDPIEIVEVIMAIFAPTTQDFDKPGTMPASKASIEAMPRIVVEKIGKDCTICLEEFVAGGEAREMPCKHAFHSDCIEKWLGMHGSCPVCRFAMPVEESDGDGAIEGMTEGRAVASLVFFMHVDVPSSGRESGGADDSLTQDPDCS